MLLPALVGLVGYPPQAWASLQGVLRAAKTLETKNPGASLFLTSKVGCTAVAGVELVPRAQMVLVWIVVVDRCLDSEDFRLAARSRLDVLIGRGICSAHMLACRARVWSYSVCCIRIN
jgi:hypothetical protein